MKRPLAITVVIPAYNEEKYIKHCLTAVTTQTFTEPFEIIVVNNNSTDKTAQIAQSFNITVISEKRQGVVYAKQTGSLAARGDIIAVLDADNIPASDWLTQIVQHMSRPELVAVTGPYRIPDHAPWWVKVENDIVISFAKVAQFLTGNSLRLWGGNVAFRKKAFQAFGGYDPKFGFTADEIKLYLDLSKHGKIQQFDELTVITSHRRYRNGFYYYFIEWGLKGYVLNSILALLFHKTTIEPKPVRKE